MTPQACSFKSSPCTNKVIIIIIIIIIIDRAYAACELTNFRRLNHIL